MLTPEEREEIARKGGEARAETLTSESRSEIGRKGGMVGGQARALKLSLARRKEIARTAAQARWKNKPPTGNKGPTP
jgi:hypothetical protein